MGKSKNAEKAPASPVRVNAVVSRLTPAQKRELDLLEKGGGSAHIFSGNLMRTFRALEQKGFVEIEAAYGQLQAGHYVYLREAC